MKKNIKIGMISILVLFIGACKPVTNNLPSTKTTNYLISSISPDSSKYSTWYYYDSNNNLIGKRTDSINDTLLYNASGQINSMVISHYNYNQRGQLDTLFMKYDSQGRIFQINASNRNNGLIFKRTSFIYDANNNVLADSNFAQIKGNSSLVALVNTNTFTNSNGNTVKLVLTYAPGHLLAYHGANPDSITQVVTTYTFDSNPNRFSSMSNNAKIAIGQFPINTNNSTGRTTIASGKINNPLYTYQYTSLYTYDPSSFLPANILVSTTGGAGVGPYHLNFSYFKVSQ